MSSATGARAATLAGLLVGVLACEGEYRPYVPAQGAGASSSLAPETAQPALTPTPGASPLELPGDGAQLTQPSEGPSGSGSNSAAPTSSAAPRDAVDGGGDSPGETDPNAPICCEDDCADAGQQCNAPVSSPPSTPTIPTTPATPPTLLAGAACTGPGDVTCSSGLLCKACNGGGNQCTAAAQCCGGCLGNQTCNNGTCGCTAQQIDCGGGLCISNAADACCPSTPACSSARPFCDSRDNTCKECLQNNQCTSGSTGTTGACTNSTCRYSCNQQAGFKDCGNTRCVPATGCCSDNDCDPCSSCSGGTCRPLAAGQPDRCPGAQDVCDGQQRCISQLSLGQGCGQANQVCTQGSCIQGRCCPGTCLQGCRADGTCNCPAGATFQNGSCRSANGSACTANADCIGNDCTQWFSDFDLDGFGTAANGSVPQLIVRTCGPDVPSGGPISGRSFAQNDDDCCDDNPQAQSCQQCGR